MTTLPGLTVVLPVHNEAPNLDHMVRAVAALRGDVADAVDLVICDDGSDDGGPAIAEASARELRLPLTLIRHQRRLGYGAAVGDGLRAATGAFVAFTDADGQFDVADLRLLVPLLERADLACGWRQERRDHGFRSVMSGTYNLLVLLALGLRLRDVDCAFKLMRREVLEAVTLEMPSALVNAELCLGARRAGFRIAQVGVPHHPRRAGRRSGGRPDAVLRALRDLVRLRIRLARRRPGKGRA